jgi:hypothetical protein
MCCDDMSVMNNTKSPESMLKEKSIPIANHAVREAVAMGEILIAYFPMNDNVVDLRTMALP